MTHLEISWTFAFLAFATTSVALTADAWLIGLPMLAALAWVVVRLHLGHFVKLRKAWLYAAIVPCAIAWAATPSLAGHPSPELLSIPAFYFLFLALMEWRSVGRGGFRVFVWFDGLAAMLFVGSAMNTEAFSVAGVSAAAMFLSMRPPVKWWKSAAAFACVAALLGGMFFLRERTRGSYYQSSSRWVENYYLQSHVMGFDPVAMLGSFRSNYVSEYNGDVALRVWSKTSPRYMRAAVYDRYIAGVWKMAEPPDMQYPAHYRIDYAVFGSADSTLPAAWVQASVNTFEFAFSPYGTRGIAVKAADSAAVYEASSYKIFGGSLSDWYYLEPDSAARTRGESVELGKDVPPSAYLGIAPRFVPLMDSAAHAMALDSSADPRVTLQRVSAFFQDNFKYSLTVPRRHVAGKLEDPVEVFWGTRAGYCEYFATFATLLLRRQGIPARYVSGFAFPERHDDYFIYRRRNAHSWVEVYAGGSWRVFDPTPSSATMPGFVPSWFSSKSDAFRAKISYLFHELKDGSWRKSVDAFQSYSAQVMGSAWFYGALAALISAVGAVVVIRRRRRGLGVYAVNSQSAAEWRKKLASAEKALRRGGFVRVPGETVGVFLARLRSEGAEKRGRRVRAALQILEAYENGRWR